MRLYVGLSVPVLRGADVIVCTVLESNPGAAVDVTVEDVTIELRCMSVVVFVSFVETDDTDIDNARCTDV